MELKLSECVFFAAWEPHDSSSHVWWTINSAQVAAAMGEERERERGKGAQCAQKTFHCVYHSTQECEGERARELQVLACFETFDTTSNAGAAAAAMAKGIITRLIDGIEFNSSR